MTLSQLQQRFMNIKFVARLNSLAWRIRRQFSSLLQGLNTAGSVPAADITTDPAENERKNPTQSRVATAAVPRERHQPPPACLLEPKPTNRHSTRLAPLPVPESDSPKDATFVFFSNLPAELRLQIWQYAVCFERVVEIQCMSGTIGFRHGATPRPPAVLHACRESRHEALKAYKVCFGTKKDPKSIYINPARDILFFRVPEQSETWRYILGQNSRWREQLKDVRRMAFMCLGRYVGPSSLRYMKKTMWAFPRLEELIVLWAEDARTRPVGGRGVNVIELAPGHANTERYTSWQSAMRWKEKIVEAWDREQWWMKFGREPPVISVRHWCMRNEGEW